MSKKAAADLQRATLVHVFEMRAGLKRNTAQPMMGLDRGAQARPTVISSEADSVLATRAAQGDRRAYSCW
jgi:hypothetical protein